MSKIGVYILRCSNGSYYTGSTDDIERRIEEHQRGKSRATKHLLPVELKAFIETKYLEEARRMELQIKKQKSRRHLEELISRHSVARQSAPISIGEVAGSSLVSRSRK